MLLLSDCSLRDGNHAVKHQITIDQIVRYAADADNAAVDLIEVGHGNGLGASSALLGRTPATDGELLRAARDSIKNSKLSAHFIPGFGRQSDIDRAFDNGLDVLRVGTHCTEANIGTRYISSVASKGREAYGVLMMSHMATEHKLLQQARLCADAGATAVVLMDSAGSSTPDVVSKKVTHLVANLQIQVGFHAHNNLGLAIANSMAAVSAGATILDGTIKGFGAGAGNAPIEVLAAVLERTGHQTIAKTSNLLKLARSTTEYLVARAPTIDYTNVLSGAAGLFSGYVPHIESASEIYQVDIFMLFEALAKRKLVAGQEDIIIEEAARLQAG
ncbi:4-hydroxy-2-oxovalerate aldolase [Salinisphaera hydrothermalis]|uniref:4-hydroxy-2-oxovalerate aldolase n=1 Tax=Salinisphaera hydrothermalis TaxID=563188 RepID=UPI00333F43B0